MKARQILILMAASLALFSCGGGGGSDTSFIGAARVSLQVEPTKIDPGDRMQVRVAIEEVHENGIALKIRFPEGLAYVLNSSFLTVNGNESDESPEFNVSDSNDNFLVYFLPQDIFGSKDSGELVFELEGTSEVSTGKVEVDADVDDPLVANGEEFLVDTPEFGAEDSVDVEVID